MEVGWRRFDGSGRGGLLTDHDRYVDEALWLSRDLIDVAAVDRLWHRVRSVPRRDDDTWSHRDLMPGNLLVREGRLTAVIDVGGLARADPALDLMPAWNLLEGAARQAFRDALGVDDERWDRGKGWALVQAIGCLPYYRHTNPPMSELARHTLLALVSDEA
jgi:aminoglycoside phosphotransferase (APT) family kinase protein